MFPPPMAKVMAMAVVAMAVVAKAEIRIKPA
jgi:hypothetical protein